MALVRDVVAKDIMSYPLVAVDIQSSVQKAARVMISKGIGSVLVSDSGHYRGIITKMDVVRVVAEAKDPTETRAGEVMSSPLKTVDAGDTVKEVARAMARAKVHRMVVRSDKGVIGIISDKDIVEVAPEIIELIEEHQRIGD